MRWIETTLGCKPTPPYILPALTGTQRMEDQPQRIEVRLTFPYYYLSSLQTVMPGEFAGAFLIKSGTHGNHTNIFALS
jgi:hypothetical protein